MKKKKNCSGKCSYKVKTNDYNKSTSERALLLVEPQTNGLQLNSKRTHSRYFPPKNSVQILRNYSSGCLFNKKMQVALVILIKKILSN